MEIKFPFWTDPNKVSMDRIDETIQLIGAKDYQRVGKAFDEPQLASAVLWVTILKRDVAAVKQVFEFFFPKSHRWYRYGIMLSEAAHNCAQFPDDSVWLEILTLLIDNCPKDETIAHINTLLLRLPEKNPAAYHQLVRLPSVKMALRQEAKNMFKRAVRDGNIATARDLLPNILDAGLVRLLFKDPNALLLFTDDEFLDRIKKAAVKKLTDKVAEELK